MEYPAWDVPISFRSYTEDEYVDEEFLFTENYGEGDSDTVEETKPSKEKYDYGATHSIVKLLLDNSSQTATWDEKTRLEWTIDIERSGELGVCECGHPIRDLCHVTNVNTGKEFILGNCCVKVLDSDIVNVFRATKSGKINKPLINYAGKHGIINDYETKFLTDVWRKRNLSSKQTALFNQLREKIFAEVS